MGSVEEQRQQRGYFVRLGSLSARLRHLAYEHTLGKLRQSKHRTQEMLAQLQETLELVSNLSLCRTGRGVSNRGRFLLAGGGGALAWEEAGLWLEVGL